MPAAIITAGALWGRAFVPWQKRHFRPRDPFGREWIALPGAEEKIAAEFGTVAMTVADADMPDLPPLNVIVTSLALPDAVMATYRTMARELFATIDGALDRGRFAADRDREAGADGERLPLGADGNAIRSSSTASRSSGCASWSRGSTASRSSIAYEFIEDLRAIRRAFGEVPALGGETGAARRRSWSRPGMRGRCRCSPFIPPPPGTGSICSMADRAWRGCRRAGRPSSPSRRSRASTGPDRPGT